MNSNTENLITKESIARSTYEDSLIQGLLSIASTPYGRDLDRHIQMVIPNNLATQKGTEAYKFLKKAGKLKRTSEAGVPVTLSEGATFTSTKTGLKETTLILDFAYTSSTNIDFVKQIMTT